MRWWHQYLLGQNNQQNPLKEFYLLPKFDVSSFSMAGEVVICICTWMLSHKKTIQTQSKPSPFDKNFKNHVKDLTQVIFNDSISGNQYNLVLQLLNRLQRFNLLFLSVTRFSDLRDKICMITTKTQNSLILDNWGNIFQIFWQYCQEPYLEPNQKSMVELFAKVVNNV